jgi:hypothetical protein
MKSDVLSVIDLLAQYSGTLEGNHFAWRQHDGFAGLGVTTASLIFFLHAKFAEAADQDVFTLLQRFLNDLEEGFDYLSTLALGKDVLGKQIFHDMRLR